MNAVLVVDLFGGCSVKADANDISKILHNIFQYGRAKFFIKDLPDLAEISSRSIRSFAMSVMNVRSTVIRCHFIGMIGVDRMSAGSD